MTDQRYVFIYRHKDETTSISFDGEVTLDTLCEKLTQFVRSAGFKDAVISYYEPKEAA